VASRRLIDDQLYDNPDQALVSSGCTLRIRRDGTSGILTYKGPGHAGPVKTREEIETGVQDVAALEGIVAALGYRPFFRAQKFREEYEVGTTHLARVALDDTPIGTFLEIEADVATIADVARALGRSPDDYILSSYQQLFAEWAAARGEPADAMLIRD